MASRASGKSADARSWHGGGAHRKLKRCVNSVAAAFGVRRKQNGGSESVKQAANHLEALWRAAYGGRLAAGVARRYR